MTKFEKFLSMHFDKHYDELLKYNEDLISVKDGVKQILVVKAKDREEINFQYMSASKVRITHLINKELPDPSGLKLKSHLHVVNLFLTSLLNDYRNFNQ